MTHREIDEIVKNPATYIKNIVQTTEFGIENIVVEHRSNNPKRDYLFVNKKQCKHIPCSPTEMVNMCKLLANEVNKKIGNREVIVVAFAETATAIGNCVADYLNNCTYVLQTTREERLKTVGKHIITFEEEHSHATTQLLLTNKGKDAFDLSTYNGYVLFVEDEISTGNTIINFIEAMNKVKSGLKYGVASVCNWQNRENKEKFISASIDTFFLLGGEIADVNAKMFPEDNTFINKSRCYNYKNDSSSIEVSREILEYGQGSLFESERLGHKTNRDFSKLFEKIYETIKDTNIKTVRIVGTEEFMYIPIKVGEFLEKNGIKVVCHATTRSCIDVLSSENKIPDQGIMERYEIESPYDCNRKTFIYNLTEHVDMTIIITDTFINNTDGFSHCDVLHNENNDNKYKCKMLSFSIL